jgi:hypothetical protein
MWVAGRSEKEFAVMNNGHQTFEKLFNIDSSVSNKFSNLSFKRSDSDNSILSTILSSSSSDDSWLDHSFLTPTTKAGLVVVAILDLISDSPNDMSFTGAPVIDLTRDSTPVKRYKLLLLYETL